MTQRNGSAADCIMGIDPGVSGALAFFFPDTPQWIGAEELPIVDGQVDAVTLAKRISEVSPTVAIIERVSSMPKQGVSSTFKFGQAYGTVIGIVSALNIPHHFVTASKWKREFSLDADKEKSRALALRLWPEDGAKFRLKKDHGKAEAALIARYGMVILHKERNQAA